MWFATPNSLLNGAGCPKCGRIRAINSKRKSNDAFVSELNTINPNVVLMEPYQGSKTKIRCYCKLHGIEWNIIPDSLLRGSGCPMCKSDKSRNAQIKDTAAFITELQCINQDIDIVDDYKGAHQKIKCCCKRCGNQWYAEPNGLIKGYGCPKCAHASSSLVEQIIYHAFSLALGEDKVLSRDKTAIGKELYVYVPSIKLAFEYGDWVLHKDRVEKDLEKIELCRKKDIKLITIYDQCHGKIKRFSHRIIYIDYDLASDAGQAYLKDFILTIFKEYGLKNSITQEQWNTIFLLASEASKLKDNNSFLAELSISNPNIEPLESYRGSMTKIKVKCKKHGIIWSTLPSSLLKGCGCSICAKNKIKKSLSKTDSEFISELLSVNSTIKPVEPYRGYKRKISVECKKCGNQWKATPNWLLHGHGCPKCLKHSFSNKKKTNEEFLRELRMVTNSIIPLQEYENGKTPILVKCITCNFCWNTTPLSLLNGHGCPMCNGGHAKMVRCIETGSVFKSTSEAAKVMGMKNSSHISACCRKERNTAGGFHWEYIDME